MAETDDTGTHTITVDLTEPEPQKSLDWLLILGGMGLAYLLLRRS